MRRVARRPSPSVRRAEGGSARGSERVATERMKLCSIEATTTSSRVVNPSKESRKLANRETTSFSSCPPPGFLPALSHNLCPVLRATSSCRLVGSAVAPCIAPAPARNPTPTQQPAGQHSAVARPPPLAAGRYEYIIL
eukprot:scaffold15359_cov104-Isochrysis_galbana.AAC.2